MAPSSSPRKLQEWEDCFTTVDPTEPVCKLLQSVARFSAQADEFS
jgi:hypothetical protein